MKHIVPDYYCKFKCIADKCRHSCCIGWEIDIDDDSYDRYKNFPGEFGDRIRKNISVNDGVASFILDKNERCPFLNCDGLCDMILEIGEDSLCGICAEHPRFHNTRTDDRIESGIGLCCEAAADIILSNTDTVKLVTLSDDGDTVDISDEDKRFYIRRDELISIAQQRDISMEKRLSELCESIGAQLPEYSFEEWTEIFLSLERLDESWDEVLRTAADGLPVGEIDEIQFEQLLVYFLYRHLNSAADDDEMTLITLFAVLSAQMICDISSRAGISMTEAARMYSSEVEYSVDNTNTLLDLLDEAAYMY